MNLDTVDPTAPHAAAAANFSSRLALLWGTSIAIAGSSLALLYSELPGLNWTLWTLAAVAGFIYWARSHDQPLGPRRITLLASMCLLAAGAAITGMLLLQVVMAGTILLLASLAIIASCPLQRSANPLALVLAPLAAAAEVVEEITLRSAEAASALRTRHSFPAVRGSLIAAPIVIAFFLLLSAADPTLERWRSSLWDSLASLDFVPRALFFIAVGIATLGAYGIAARAIATDASSTGTAESSRPVLSSVERLIVLGAVAALFALFLVLQLSYLFGDSGSRAGSGLTYADAAHRGFIELTLTVTLSAVLIIVLQRLARHDAQEHLVKYCALMLVAELLPMLLSANSRIAHYEAAYGYTLLRLYVHVYIALVCVATLLLARQVLTAIDLLRLCEQLGIAIILALAVLAFWNHARWIVARNLERYASEQELDLSYLAQLSTRGPDAIAPLVASLARLAPADAEQLRRFLLLSDSVRGTLDYQPARWYRWNLRRAEARRALQELAGQSAN